MYAVDSQTGDASNNVTGTWLITEELFVQDGYTLQVRAFAFCFPLVLVSQSVHLQEGRVMCLLVVLLYPTQIAFINTRIKCGATIPHKYFLRSSNSHFVRTACR